MTTKIPESPDALLRRKATAEALTAAGFPITALTLTSLSTRGKGPTYRTFGSRIVLYRWSDALAWAEGRLSAPRRSTSEADITVASSMHDYLTRQPKAAA